MISAGWLCKKCGELRVFRGDKAGLDLDVAYALWQAENYGHLKGHEVAGKVVEAVKQGGVANG